MPLDMAVLTSLLCVCLQVRDWQLAGLPSDDVSTDNAIMVMHRRLWPLVVDPQVPCRSRRIVCALSMRIAGQC